MTNSRTMRRAEGYSVPVRILDPVFLDKGSDLPDRGIVFLMKILLK